MKKNDKIIYVTQPSLPDLNEFIPYLEKIWDNKWLTNKGPFHQEFEKALCDFLGVKYISLFANGTLAILTALRALKITGEVITTPFSFVATTHSLHWNGIKPVFCDIEEDTFNIDPEKIEKLITSETTAILPVHVYGTPCDTERIEKIAVKHGLKVIYDAAHAFGVKKSDESILNSGDLSVLSFHATKVFQTFEGGAIICHDENTKKEIDLLKNFGFAGEEIVIGTGINAKMSEFSAALGVLQLKHINKEIEGRQKIADFYRRELETITGITCLSDINEVKYNYSYFPILVDKKKFGISRDELYDIFKRNSVYVRKYFHPLISDFPVYSGLESAHPDKLPIAGKITKQVLCLPIYSELSGKDSKKIVGIIKKG